MKRFLLGMVLFAASGGAALAQSSLATGTKLLKDKEYRGAADFFSQFVRAYPRDSEAWLSLTKAYLGTGQLDSAEFTGRKAVQYDDENPFAYATLADVLIRSNKLGQANEVLREGLDEAKDHPNLLLQLGNLQMASDSVDAALVSFTRATVVAPGLPRAYEGMGDVYARQGVVPMAIRNWERSLELDENQTTLLSKLADYFIDNRRYNDAVKTLRKLVDLDPVNLEARFKLGHIYYRAKLYPAAAQVFEEFVKKNPNDTDAVKMYTEALYKSRQFQMVPQYADMAFKLDPTFVEAMEMKAVSLYALKEYPKAIATFRQFERIGEMTPLDYQYLGKSYELIENNDSAVVAYERAVALDSSQTNVMNDAGTAYMRMKRWEDAARMFRARFTYDSSAVTAYINYAQCMLVMERFEEAAHALVVAIESAPDYVPSYTNLGIAYLQMKDYPKAKTAFERSITVIDTAESKYMSDLAKAYRYIGLVQLLDKSWNDAIGNLRKSLNYEPNDESTLLWLAQGLQNAQKKDEAIKYYKAVLKVNKDNEQAKKGLEVLEGNAG